MNPRRVAAFDLGSNALKLTVVEDGPQPTTVFLDEYMTRLSEGTALRGELHPNAVARTLDALEASVRQARTLGAESLRGVATASLRTVDDPVPFLTEVKRRVGLDLEVISGDREAQLTFRSTVLSESGSRLVIDLGGRSTELAVGGGRRADRTLSIPVGSVGLTERFLGPGVPSAQDVSRLDAYLLSVLGQPSAAAATWRAPVILGTSATVLAVLGYEHGHETPEEVLDAARAGALLTPEAATRWAETLTGLSPEARLRGRLVPKGRADVIAAGARWLAALLRHLQMSVRVSTGSVGLGLALETLSGGTEPAQ